MGRGEGGGHEGGVGSLLPLLNLISAINGHAWFISLLSKHVAGYAKEEKSGLNM